MTGSHATTMKFWIFIFIALNCSPFCTADGLEKMYYVGEAKMSGPGGEPRGSQAFLLEKTHDPERNFIIERAIVVKPDRTVEEHIMTMVVKGNDFTISDARKSVQGAGQLFGKPWEWSYFKAVYQSTNGARIEDENFMADRDVLVARKRISAPNGTVVAYMDITLKEMTPATFRILSECLLKPIAVSTNLPNAK